MPTCAFACAHTHHTHTTFKMHFRSSAPCCVHYGFFQFLLLGGEKHLRVGVMLQHPGGNRDSLRYQFLPSSLFEESLGFFFFSFSLGVISFFTKVCASGFTLGLGVQTRTSCLYSGTFPCRTIFPVPCDSYYKVSSIYTFRSSLGSCVKDRHRLS